MYRTACAWRTLWYITESLGEVRVGIQWGGRGGEGGGRGGEDEKRGISWYECMRNVIGSTGTDSIRKAPSPELLLLPHSAVSDVKSSLLGHWILYNHLYWS